MYKFSPSNHSNSLRAHGKIKVRLRHWGNEYYILFGAPSVERNGQSVAAPQIFPCEISSLEIC